jgi:hypothetical protein
LLLALIQSSIVAGVMATTVMIVFLYLPAVWGGVYYDTLGAVGSITRGRVDDRARVLGAMLLFLGGILFAAFYGAFVLMFMKGPFPPSPYIVFPRLGTEVNLFYPLLGLVGGLGHGIYMSLISTFILTDFHPVEAYRSEFPLVLSYLMGHMVFGVVVMFFQHQLLQVLLP